MGARKRVGIVGIEHYHTTGWVDSIAHCAEKLDVVALYDSNPAMGESLAPTWHDPHLSATLDERYRELPFETDLDQLIAQHDLDVALVTLPNVQAPEVIRKLAAAGVHILVDKPGASNAREAADVFEFARSRGVRVACGLLRRYGRGWRHARSMIAEGRTGRLLSAEAIFNTSSPFVRNPDNHIFRKDLQGGGILMWLGVHDVDQLLWLTGERIVEVQAMSGQVNAAGIDVEDTMSVAMRFEHGAIGTMHSAYVLPRTLSEGYLAVRGTLGSVTIGMNGAVKWTGGGTAADPVTEETLNYTNYTVPGYGSMAPSAVEDLLASIEEGRDPLANGFHLVDALRVIDSIYESAQSGKRVEVNWGAL